jgi:hypothetical protein
MARKPLQRNTCIFFHVDSVERASHASLDRVGPAFRQLVLNWALELPRLSIAEECLTAMSAACMYGLE